MTESTSEPTVGARVVRPRARVEHRLETDNRPDYDYASYELTGHKLATKQYRRHVGGMWDRMGVFQLDFLRAQGLRPEHRFLDVGCGSLRAGRVLVDYLEPAHYYGIDISPTIIETGYELELDDGQRARMPLSNLHATDRFDCTFGDVRFDMAIAQSVFSHVPLNLMRLCLHRLAQVMRPGGTFFATFFERAPGTPVDAIERAEGSPITTYAERNPYCYYRRDMEWIAEELPWTPAYVGDWGHPRGQRMMAYVRTDG